MIDTVLNCKQFKEMCGTPIRKTRGRYIIEPCAFDIETTTQGELSYMYHWQFAISRYAILGRTWDEFFDLLAFVAKRWRVTPKHRIIIWVHNFSYEFSFLKFRADWARKKDGTVDIFASTNTRIIKAVTSAGFEFRDSYVQSGYSLGVLAKNYCTTQKAVGDLDYKKMRNSKTPLTKEERRYCINDVAILIEYADYLYKKFSGKIPLTKTGIPRQAIKDNFKSRPDEYQENATDVLRKAFPDKELYELLMSHLYAGGYAHANYIYTGDLLELVASFDFKSAYPSECFNLLPYQLRRLPVKYFPEIIKEWKTTACMIECVFCCISTKTTHSIFSVHKAERDSIGILADNGRVRYADVLHCYLTEYDYFNFCNFYAWDEMQVKKLWYAEKHYLPRYVLDEVASYYEQKNSLPKGTPEYAEAKEKLNSIYGMMVTGLYHDELIFDEDSGDFYPSNHEKSYYKLIKGKLLLPQWGVWITAAVRYHLLSELCAKFPDDWIYSDTDSGKILNYKKHLPEIEAYNARVLARNAEIEKEYGYHLGKLGIFDFEGVYEKFKTLGAKRYIYQQDGKVNVACAGLPKNALPEYCEKYGLNIWDTFTDQMLLRAQFTGKLRTKYTNKEYSGIIADEYGNAEKMTEKSGVALIDTPFQLSMADDYAQLVKEYKEKNQRIYGKRDF